MLKIGSIVTHVDENIEFGKIKGVVVEFVFDDVVEVQWFRDEPISLKSHPVYGDVKQTNSINHPDRFPVRLLKLV